MTVTPLSTGCAGIGRNVVAITNPVLVQRTIQLELTSMHTDRKPVGHIAQVVGARALVVDYLRASPIREYMHLYGQERIDFIQ